LAALAFGVADFKSQSIAEGLLALGYVTAQPFTSRFRVPGTLILASILGVALLGYTAYRFRVDHRSQELAVRSAIESTAH
jgi:hypothetical protein